MENKEVWEEEYKERFGADYAEWGRSETTEDAIDFIKSLLSTHHQKIVEEIENWNPAQWDAQSLFEMKHDVLSIIKSKV